MPRVETPDNKEEERPTIAKERPKRTCNPPAKLSPTSGKSYSSEAVDKWREHEDRSAAYKRRKDLETKPILTAADHSECLFDLDDDTTYSTVTHELPGIVPEYSLPTEDKTVLEVQLLE